MPLITFNERQLELSEDNNNAGPVIASPGGLASEVANFASSKDLHRRLTIAPDLDWKSVFTVWPTGGGAVRNAEGKYLLIRRLGWWDLPKGKLDPGESISECALREVTEETGVDQLRILKPLLLTYHSYEEQGLRILKENHWYLIETSFTGPLKAQAEEDITECLWLDEAGIRERWSGMYRAVQEVLETALNA